MHLVLHYGSTELQTYAAYALSWFMLLSGVRFALTLRSNAGDADTLRGLTRVPGFVWAALWLVITVTAYGSEATSSYDPPFAPSPAAGRLERACRVEDRPVLRFRSALRRCGQRRGGLRPCGG